MASIPYAERKFDRKHAQEYDAEYKRNNYDRINFLMPKGYKDRIKQKAENEGISVSEWLRNAIDDKLNN